MAHYLDDDACAALARGKEQLAKERAQMAEVEHLGKTTSTDPVQPSISADNDIVGSNSHSPPPVKLLFKVPPPALEMKLKKALKHRTLKLT